ncbi:MAG: PCMD domain-containing protein [bacterium]
MKKYILPLLFFIIAQYVCAQEATERIVPIKFGSMEHWTVRYIKESKLLGGDTKTLYILAPTDTISENEPFDFKRKTVWGISNAYANIMGIAKASLSTQPEKRGNGWCARLDTKLETVKVLGVIDIEVCVAGALFLGSVIEPVKSINDPYSVINVGVPFTGKPTALMLDIKTRVNTECKVVKALGMGKSYIDGHDEPEVYVFLQRRWEDEKGNVYSRRIATAYERFPTTISSWKNKYRIPLTYGDITGQPFYKSYMGLDRGDKNFKVLNSKGKMVQLQEVEWGDGDDTPTHVIVMVAAGCYPAFYGSPGNAIWVDNISWVY